MVHDHATRSGGLLGSDLDDLKQRSQHAAGHFIGAGHQAVRLMHRHHHGAEIIRLEHRFARFAFPDAFVAAQQLKTARETVKFLAFLGIEHAHAFQRDVQAFGGFFDFRAVAEQNGHAESQRIKLAGRLQHARLGSLRKDNALGVALQFFDDAADESHGRLVTERDAKRNRGISGARNHNPQLPNANAIKREAPPANRGPAHSCRDIVCPGRARDT